MKAKLLICLRESPVGARGRRRKGVPLSEPRQKPEGKPFTAYSERRIISAIRVATRENTSRPEYLGREFFYLEKIYFIKRR